MHYPDQLFKKLNLINQKNFFLVILSTIKYKTNYHQTYFRRIGRLQKNKYLHLIFSKLERKLEKYFLYIKTFLLYYFFVCYKIRFHF